MKNEQDFYDRTLIRLKRQYGKEEVVAALIKKLSEAETEIGKLNAEIDYLQNELQSDKEQKEINKLAKIEARKDELYHMKVEENKKQRAEIKQLRHIRNDLISKCSELEKKRVQANPYIGGSLPSDEEIKQIDNSYEQALILPKSDVNKMTYKVDWRCTKCEAKAGTCDCWHPCPIPGCHWMVEKGCECNNPEHK